MPNMMRSRRRPPAPAPLFGGLLRRAPSLTVLAVLVALVPLVPPSEARVGPRPPGLLVVRDEWTFISEGPGPVRLERVWEARITAAEGIANAELIVPVGEGSVLESYRGGTKNGETWTKTRKEHLVEMPAPTDAFHSDRRSVLVTFPATKIGSFLHLDYAIAIGSMTDFGVFFPRSHQLPTEKTKLALEWVPSQPIRWQALDLPEPIRSKNGAFERAVWNFGRSGPPGDGSQPPPPQWEREARRESPRVLLRLDAEIWSGHRLDATTWEGIGRWYASLSSGLDRIDGSMKKAVADATVGAATPEAKAAALLRLIQTRFTYTQVYLGIGNFQPHAAIWTWNRGYGDCKDLATLYIALCREAGLRAWPALIHSEGRRLFREGFPSPNQFNHCIVVVELPDGPHWVDCTSTTAAFGSLPSGLRGVRALVVRADGAGVLETTPADPDDRNQETRTVTFVADGERWRVRLDGRIQGDDAGLWKKIVAGKVDDETIRSLARRMLFRGGAGGERFTRLELVEEPDAIRYVAEIDLGASAIRADGKLLVPLSPVDWLSWGLDRRLHPSAARARLHETIRFEGAGQWRLPGADESTRTVRAGTLRSKRSQVDGVLVVERTLDWTEPAEEVREAAAELRRIDAQERARRVAGKAGA